MFSFHQSCVGLLSDINLLYPAIDHRVLNRCLFGALKHWTACKICDVSVSIGTGAIGCTAKESWFNSWHEREIFLFLCNPHQLWIQPNLCVGNMGSSPRLKQAGHTADDSSLSGAKLRMNGSIPPLPHIPS